MSKIRGEEKDMLRPLKGEETGLPVFAISIQHK
jgi:hypothetical protein